jgi:hypothetical protein
MRTQNPPIEEDAKILRPPNKDVLIERNQLYIGKKVFYHTKK